VARAKPNLADWWFAYLDEPRRQRLMDEADQPLDPDFALDLWRGSHAVRVVEPEHWSIDTDPDTWRLTAEAAAFVRARAAERAVGGRPSQS